MTDSTIGQAGFLPERPTMAVRRLPQHGPHHQRVTWAMFVPYVVAVAAVVLAGVTLAMLIMFKGSAESQISQLRAELTAAQQAQVTTAGTVAGLRDRINGLSTNLNAVGQLVSPFTTVCSTDLTGPNGPAQYDFLCAQHK